MTEQIQDIDVVEGQSRMIEPIKMGSLLPQTSQDVVVIATSIANQLAKIIDEQQLFTIISGKKYVYVEGWTTLGAMLGITPKEKYVKKTEDNDYEAYVDLIRNSDGMVIGGASSIVSGDEPHWKNRPRYARRSMSVTRATGKAFRLLLSWIMQLAGYEPTPAEEMPIEGEYRESPQPSKAKSRDEAPEHDYSVRPYAPDVLKDALNKRATGKYASYKGTEKQRNLLGALLSEYFQDDDKRHTVQLWLMGAASTKDMEGGMVKASLDWLASKPDEGGAYLIDDMARQELSSVLPEALKAEGQETLI